MTAVTPAQATRLIAKAKRTALDDRLLADLAKLGLPVPEREYEFHPSRKWRFDLAYPDIKLGIECDGGTWSGGRHVRGAGYQRDAEKFNAASSLGWCVFHYTGAMIRSGYAAREIAEALGGEEGADMSSYGYRIEVWEHDVEGHPCSITELDTQEDGEALVEAHKRLAEGASSAVIQLITTWRQL